MPSIAWAKLERDPQGRVARRLSISDHCADVAACFRALLVSPVIRARLAALAGIAAFEECQLTRLTVLAGLHDIGKYNRGFQNRALDRPPFVAGHVREVLALWNATNGDAERLMRALRLDMLRGWGAEEDTLDELLIASIAHHGRPYHIENGGLVHHARNWIADADLDPFGSIATHLSQLSAWLPEAFEIGGPPLPHATSLQHALNGLLTLADWVGSDVQFFPFDGVAGHERFAWARARAQLAVREIGLDPRMSRASLGDERPAFRMVFANEPYAMQQVVSELPIGKGGSVTVLESETGTGKTEAAVIRFLALYHEGVVDGMYFALPTRTAAIQMHRRVHQAVARAFASRDARPAVVLAVPGYIEADDRKARRLPGFEVLWDDEDREHWRARGWAAERPKRYLAGAVVVGTVDQALLSTLMVPHAHLRAMALARQLLVVDEVHASDAYMTRLLEDVLARHIAAGGHALLMSATLGGAARERLVAPSTGATVPPFPQACDVPYPMVTHRRAGATTETRTFPAGRARKVSVRLSPDAGDGAAVARQALESARRAARVLVIRNTVRECIETQQELESVASDDPLLLLRVERWAVPHHSRYGKEDREALDAALMATFGKECSDLGCVAVATQTVQQSLDIDADLLLTDLCPVDVLLQRIGRLHRRADRIRPAGFESPVAIVLTPPNRDLGQFIQPRGEARGPHGVGTVYPDMTILEATWRLAEAYPAWDIPAMCRMLVERATHPEALRAIEAELGSRWETHGQITRGQFFAHRRLASLNLVNWDTPFGECQFPSGELSREVRTRLGADDRVATFDRVLASPFGRPVRELTIPAHLVQGARADAAPLDVDTTETYIRFTFGARRYVYDRLGLRSFTTSSPDDDEADA